MHKISADEFEQGLSDGEYQGRTFLAYVSVGKGRACLGHLLLFIDGYCFAYNYSDDGFKPQLFPGTDASEKYIRNQGRKIFLIELDLKKDEMEDLARRIYWLAATYKLYTRDSIHPVFYLNNCSTLLSRDLSSAAIEYRQGFITRLFPYFYFDSVANMEGDFVIGIVEERP